MQGMESSTNSLETEQESKALLMQKLLYEAHPASQALGKREAMEPFLNPLVHSGMLKAESSLEQKYSGNIREMDWENSERDSFSGYTPQLSVKEESNVANRDGNENCSAGHLDHRDHTYACIAQAKANSAIKQEKERELNLETTLMPSSWWQPLCGVDYNPQGISTANNVSTLTTTKSRV